jgi:endonuclease-3
MEDKTDAKSSYLSKIYAILAPLWPDARPLLHYKTCFELLCAVILSAQCTDEQVNAATPKLFSRFPEPTSMALANIDEVEGIIHSVGFFHTKARHLIETARLIVQRFGGTVPGSFDSLLELPGVGRKTANLVISACFDVPGIIVDTHVLRVATRMGICAKRDAFAVEKTISQALDESKWTAFSHALNRHGKFVCTSRHPACARDDLSCPLEGFCPKIGIAEPLAR